MWLKSVPAQLLVLSALFLLMILISPVCHLHYFCLSIPILMGLIAATWDDWKNLPARREELNRTDIYTLRRIVPKDRGFDW